MTSNWFPPRNRQSNNDTPYVADNGDIVNCIATGGIATQPYKRFRGYGGGTYNDFALNTPSLPSHHLIFQLPNDKPIYPRGMMLSSWTEDAGLDDRAFGAMPTRFLLSASNDGQTWTPIFNQSETLTIEYLVDNKFSTINDGLDDPVKDFDIYSGITDTTGVKIEDVYFKTFDKTETSYTWFKLSFDSNSPDYRIDKQYNSTAPPPYIPTDSMRISNFAVYGDDFPTPPPYNPPTTEYQIVDFAMALDPFQSNAVFNELSEGVNTLFALINPNQYTAQSQYGLFQAISVPSLNQGYIRVAKTGTNITNLVADTPYRLKINFFPADNQKDLTFVDGGITYKEYVFDDDFHYFLMEDNFGVVGDTPVPFVENSMAGFYHRLNPFYNILNYAGVDYESGAVAHPSSNFAKTFGMITDVNNSLVQDPHPQPEIYPTPQVGIIDISSLTWNSYQKIGIQIYPFKYSEIIIQDNKAVIKLDKNATHDLYKAYLQLVPTTRLFIAESLILDGMDTITDVIIVDDDTGRIFKSPLSGYTSFSKQLIVSSRYTSVLTLQDVYDLTTIPTDPVLPAGMPDELMYNKIKVSSTEPFNLNELIVYENGLNNMTNSYIKAIYNEDTGIYTNSINNGDITQRKAVWGTDTLTQEQLETIVADSSVNPNTITLTDTGINYHKVAGNTGKFNFYSHADGGNINNLQIGDVKGYVANFTATAGAINAPFFGIYTKRKNDGFDKGSWYRSRYVLTDSAVSERITSGKVYTLADALGIATLISEKASYTDEILAVSIGSGSADTAEWDINIRSVDLLSDYVGKNLTIEYGHEHNLAITQNAVIYSTHNQIGMSLGFYKDDTLVFQTTGVPDDGGLEVPSSINYKFSLVDENAYSGEIVADLVIDEELPFYLNWTKPSHGYIDFAEVRANFLATSSVLWGETFSPADKILNSVGAHLDKLRQFDYRRMTGSYIDVVVSYAISAGLSTAEIMYMKQGFGFGLSAIHAVEYGFDKVKPQHPRVVKLISR